MNVNKKPHQNHFLENAWPIYFVGLSNYLDLFQKRLSTSSFKNNY